MTDCHARTLRTAGVLTAIEKQCADKKPAFLIDGGDFSASAYSIEAVTEVYKKFAERNPHIKNIFNLGNCEIDDFKAPQLNEKFNKYIKELTEKGVEFVCAPIKILAKKTGLQTDNIKAYTIIEDEKQKILITGITTTTDRGKSITLEDQKNSLKEFVAPAIKEHNPDKVILLSHNYVDKTKEIVEYMKKELGVKKLELVIGGHPHSLEDENQDITRILYPPSQGKGAIEINHSATGFEMPKMNIFAQDKHDHLSLNENKTNIISNNNINIPSPIEPIYKEIMRALDKNDMEQVIAKSTTNLSFRKPGKYASETSGIGSFITNAMRDQTKSDIAILLSQDTRERLPQKGYEITLYNVKDTLNANKLVYTMSVKPNQLVDIFETSFKKQHENASNSNFFEFSDNIKIERFVNRAEGEPKVKQISINGEALLEENESGEKLKAKVKKRLENKTFTLATCSFIAKGDTEGKRREGLELFEYIESNESKLKTEDIFIKALKENESKKNPTSPKSEIIDDIS